MNYINKGKRDILIFPKFCNINKIQEIRKEHDELYGIIMPHITIAFPFEISMPNDELKEKLQNILPNIKPFKIICKGISLKKDNRINKYYIFLNIVEGEDNIKLINKRIYEEILTNKNIDNYTPHITLGTTDNKKEKIELTDKFETVVNEIVVESIGENEESIIEFVMKLGD